MASATEAVVRHEVMARHGSHARGLSSRRRASTRVLGCTAPVATGRSSSATPFSPTVKKMLFWCRRQRDPPRKLPASVRHCARSMLCLGASPTISEVISEVICLGASPSNTSSRTSGSTSRSRSSSRRRAARELRGELRGPSANSEVISEEAWAWLHSTSSAVAARSSRRRGCSDGASVSSVRRRSRCECSTSVSPVPRSNASAANSASAHASAGESPRRRSSSAASLSRKASAASAPVSVNVRAAPCCCTSEGVASELAIAVGTTVPPGRSRHSRNVGFLADRRPQPQHCRTPYVGQKKASGKGVVSDHTSRLPGQRRSQKSSACSRSASTCTRNARAISCRTSLAAS